MQGEFQLEDKCEGTHVDDGDRARVCPRTSLSAHELVTCDNRRSDPPAASFSLERKTANEYSRLVSEISLASTRDWGEDNR